MMCGLRTSAPFFHTNFLAGGVADRVEPVLYYGINGTEHHTPSPEILPGRPGQPATSSQRALCISVVGSRGADTVPSGRYFTLAGRTVPKLQLQLCRHRGRGFSALWREYLPRMCVCVGQGRGTCSGIEGISDLKLPSVSCKSYGMGERLGR